MRLRLLFALIGASIVFPINSEINQPQSLSRNKHHEFRQYTCIKPDELETSECRLTFMSNDEEPTTITDNGCFIERSGDHLIRNYCPLQCSDHDFAYVLAQRPDSSEKSCALNKGFGVVRRRKDWFLWRTLGCSLTEVQFDFGCTKSLQNVNDDGLEGEGSGLD